LKIGRSLRLSIRQLGVHKTRTALALLGIVIGVGTVIVMVAVGRGARLEILGRIENMGTDLIIVNAGPVVKSAGRLAVRGTATTLTLEDAEAVLLECPSVVDAAPVQSRKLPVKADGAAVQTTVVGTTPTYLAVRKFRIAAGTFFSEEENRATRRVAVLGISTAFNLFGIGNPIGETIRIGRVLFEVIGLLAPKGTDMNGVDQDDQILIPVRTALRRVFNVAHIDSISAQARVRRDIGRAQEEVRLVLRERHRLDRRDKPDDFTIQSQVDLLQAAEETSRSLTLLTAGIAGVSLLVGGIGILAVMLMSVRERRNEIGLRRAVGAARKDIRIQFLFEAGLLAFGGGTAGAILGILGSLAAGLAANWPTSISFASVLLAFGFSVLVGLFFGVVPARRAARLNPVVALRSE
jgi:putative ABC transport system permease protein